MYNVCIRVCMYIYIYIFTHTSLSLYIYIYRTILGPTRAASDASTGQDVEQCSRYTQFA